MGGGHDKLEAVVEFPVVGESHQCARSYQPRRKGRGWRVTLCPVRVVHVRPPFGWSFTVKQKCLAWWWWVHSLRMLWGVLLPRGQGVTWSFWHFWARRWQPGKVQVMSRALMCRASRVGRA